jgi:two-component system LytT family response regulator
MKDDVKGLKVAIVDDEKHGRETIKTLISRNFPDIEICGEADTVASAIELLAKCTPDILFLDIELSDGTGFDILETLHDDIQFEIIFATAFNYYAIKAIKFSALDYLLKPVDVAEFISAVENAICKIANSNYKSQNINFLKKQLTKQSPDKVALPTETGYIFVLIDEIIRCHAESNYTTFFMKDGKSFLISRTLKEYEELLKDNNFFRVHNSHLINMAYVMKYIKGKTPRVVMSDGTEVEISSRKRDEFLKNFAKL